ncbi:M23 family metallopeptidase [Jeongeupia wiesaeckerbachi]|uniref:M23 family metallopeptidase n=1 Tax=Jeongeupia wiesaeckerbachi TaxID=3051218 RepID=UPI003D8039D4
MNIILVSSRFARAISLGPAALTAMLVGVLGLGLTAGAGIALLARGERIEPRWPLARPVHANVDALAVRLGELQAKLTRLDGLAKQLGSRTGIDVTPFLSDKPAPRGGLTQLGTALDASDLSRLLGDSDNRADAYLDQFSLAQLRLAAPAGDTLPTRAPMQSGLQSSSFGWRLDPFSGRQTFHEGIDFVGPIGTPIHAAAAGKVAYAAAHSQYGNMVELDHGYGLTSRYAHASRLLVQPGDSVSAGQTIALLGSTGRSTGPHLHFEIRYKQIAQNPLRFVGSAQDSITSSTASSD